MRLSALLQLAVAFCAGAALLPAQAAPQYHQITLHAQAQRNVVHDLMRVTLYSESQDADPARLAEATTRVLNAAIVKARAASGVTVQTGSRASSPVYAKDNQRVTAWRERAELHLESSDFAALAALTSELMATLKIASRQFIISPASRKTHEDSLLLDAIAAFRARALLAAQAFGGSGYRLVSVSLDGGGFRPLVVRQRVAASGLASMASSASYTYQEIEAGTSEVSVTASGVVEVLMD